MQQQGKEECQRMTELFQILLLDHKYKNQNLASKPPPGSLYLEVFKSKLLELSLNTTSSCGASQLL